MDSAQSDIPSDQSLPHSLPQQASHLAELGAMSQLYAHEVNNLLTQVSARAQLALMRPDDADLSAHALRAVGDCCDRINQLTQIFLTPANQSQGTEPSSMSTAPQRVQRSSVASVHAQVVRMIRDADRSQFGFELNDETEGYAPDMMPMLLEQVLTNLILNALRAVHEHPSLPTQSHSICVRAKLEDHPACSTWNTPTKHNDASSMLIIVEDTGIGMTPSQVTQLLNGMAVESNAAPSSDQFTRHGLGMRVCRKLLNTVGGQLGCESKPMQGTRMSIRIPAIKLDASSDSRAAA